MHDLYAVSQNKNNSVTINLSQVSDLTNGTTLQEGHDKRPDFTLDEQLPDRGDFGGGDFLEDGFGFGDGGMGEFGDLPNVPDLTVDEPQKGQEEGGQT